MVQALEGWCFGLDRYREGGKKDEDPGDQKIIIGFYDHKPSFYNPLRCFSLFLSLSIKLKVGFCRPLPGEIRRHRILKELFPMLRLRKITHRHFHLVQEFL